MDLELKHKMKTIDKLENRLHTTNTSVRNLQQKLYCSNAKVETTSTENTEHAFKLETLESEFTAKVDELQQKIQCLITEVNLARHERDILSERLDDMESNTVRTKQGQKFIDGVRQCCIELLSMNVGTKQVESVIRSVLRNIVSIEVGELPKPSTLCGMLAEMKCLAYQQISDEVGSQENATLHSDGTSKFGHHYGSYQISTDASVYSLGLCDMLTGSAELTLHSLKQILGDLDQVAGTGSGNNVLLKIKNTMSDRHIVQKKFNFLLEDYRAEILPSMVDNWDELTTAEQDHFSSLNNFFCGMHVLVGMADTTSSSLLTWEKTHFETPVGAAAAIHGNVRIRYHKISAYSMQSPGSSW